MEPYWIALISVAGGLLAVIVGWGLRTWWDSRKETRGNFLDVIIDQEGVEQIKTPDIRENLKIYYNHQPVDALLYIRCYARETKGHWSGQ